jgi:glutathione S-transferase
MTRKLYYTQRSPYARKVRIVLAEKQLPCELVETDIKRKSPEFLSLNPIGKIPVLVDENGLTFWDSTLIVEYLDETYPHLPFYPRDRLEKLRCRQGEELADSLIDRVVALWYETGKAPKADEQLQAYYQQEIDRLLFVLENKLDFSSYLLNDQFTAVDVAAVSGLGYYTFRFGKNWQLRYPKLTRWFERLHQRPSLQSTLPQA